MKEVILKVFITMVLVGVDVIGIRLIGDNLYLGLLFLVIGSIGIILTLLSRQVFKLIKWIKFKIMFVFRVLRRMKEADKYITIKDEQQKNPQKWLYPVIEYIDLNRQGLPHNDNDIFVRFQIDSFLLSPINEFYVSVKLILADTVTFLEVESKDWHEIELQGAYPPIRPLERYSFSDTRVHFGETDDEKEKNKLLLEMMERFRNGHQTLAMLKVGIKFKKGDSPILLEGNGRTKYIAPINNYRDC